MVQHYFQQSCDTTTCRSNEINLNKDSTFIKLYLNQEFATGLKNSIVDVRLSLMNKGLPRTAVNPGNIDAVQKMTTLDRDVIDDDNVAFLNISRNRVHSIFTGSFGIQKTTSTFHSKEFKSSSKGRSSQVHQ